MSGKVSSKKTFGATMLVTGCCIGAGMIGLPILSSLTGFLPSVVAMIFCYIFTTFTAFCSLKSTLWFDGRINLPTIVEFALGRIEKINHHRSFPIFILLPVRRLSGRRRQSFFGMIAYVLHTPVQHYVGVVKLHALHRRHCLYGCNVRPILSIVGCWQR